MFFFFLFCTSQLVLWKWVRNVLLYLLYYAPQFKTLLCFIAKIREWSRNVRYVCRCHRNEQLHYHRNDLIPRISCIFKQNTLLTEEYGISFLWDESIASVVGGEASVYLFFFIIIWTEIVFTFEEEQLQKALWLTLFERVSPWWVGELGAQQNSHSQQRPTAFATLPSRRRVLRVSGASLFCRFFFVLSKM